jgi:2-keto-3-deoxy-L-rhamnonate aldolase RhmA
MQHLHSVKRVLSSKEEVVGMPLKLMYITNNETVARIAEKSGVDWIFVDLEINGKKERQGHLDTVVSYHKIEDVSRIRKVLVNSQLLVRVNPIYERSEEEISRVISDGADIVMLPFFRKKDEVAKFVELVDGRANACLLLETPEAVGVIESILQVGGIDFVHIGLNDLHLGYKLTFMFELLANGTVEMLCTKIRQRGIPFGFGGIARIGEGVLAAERIMAEHYRLGSSMTILSRSFCNVGRKSDIRQIEETFRIGVAEIRDYESRLSHESPDYFERNRREVCRLVDRIVADR